MQSLSIANKRPLAVIVDSGPDLGRSMARKFADLGYRVAILAKNLDRISRVAEEIRREYNTEAYVVGIDCCDERNVIEAVKSLGPFKVFVCNYNAYPPSPTSKL